MTSSKGQQVITSSKGKKQENKKEEARSNSRRPGPSLRALLFGCGAGAVLGQTALEDRQVRELVFLSVQKATLGTGGRGPQARSVLQGPAVSVWRRRRL